MNQYHRLGTSGALSPAIKNILFANGVLFLLTQLNTSLGMFINYNFALSAEGVFGQFKIWQLVTYMFLHGGFWHIFFNMFILWMFGTELEYSWGTKEFLKYYFLTGIGGGILNLLLSGEPTIGASAAVYGIMVAYAISFPDRLVYIYFLFPVKVKYLMGFLALFAFFSTIGPNTSNVAHAAHLGGIVIGFIYLKYWYLYYKVKSLLNSTMSSSSGSSAKMKFTKGGAEDKTEFYRHKIDELLDKINKVGYLNLTDEEKRLLDEGSRYLREHDSENYN
ncbi:MAG: rhomboid family intramembrane serine protease [Calditrichae bacterium]|nr:rhomboid family intramembrane serine protease [Calditrichota bacterium]MCB9058208.1 rhomboid family intramembrane serine protease [Calditrichia bacterium]